MEKLAFISQPMKDLSEKQIQENRAKAVAFLESKGYKIIDSIIKDFENIESKNKPLLCLGEALKKMAEADLVYFCKGWENARGCKIEEAAARAYGIKIEYE